MNDKAEGGKWHCYECGSGHDATAHYCPRTGVARVQAAQPPPAGVPVAWRNNSVGWHKFKTQIEYMTDEERTLAGIANLKAAGELKALRWLLERMRPLFEKQFAYAGFADLAVEAEARVGEIERDLETT